MKKILATFLIFSSIGLGVIAFGVGGSPRPNTSADAPNRSPDVDNTSAIVQLKGDPLTTYSATKPAPGRKIDFNSYAVRSYRAQLVAARNEFKRWLRANAPRARVTSEYDISLNAVAVQLNGTPLATIAAAPMVARAEYNALYSPNLSQSHFIINADPAWIAAGGRAVAGAGIKIGDIDTGIDNAHPFFDPTGFSYPPGFPKCDAADSNSHHQDQDCKYVSQKVIVAKVFYNKNNQTNFDAQAIQDHGTHTAGIAAGIFNPSLNAVVHGVMIDGMSGIAPGAWLGNYNVFPGSVTNARSAKSSQSVQAQIGISSVSRSRTQLAVAQRLVRQWVSFHRYPPPRLASSLIASSLPAPALIQALRARSWWSTAVVAPLAQRCATQSLLELPA